MGFALPAGLVELIGGAENRGSLSQPLYEQLGVHIDRRVILLAMDTRSGERCRFSSLAWQFGQQPPHDLALEGDDRRVAGGRTQRRNP